MRLLSVGAAVVAVMIGIASAAMAQSAGAGSTAGEGASGAGAVPILAEADAVPVVEPIVLIDVAVDGSPPVAGDRRIRGCGVRAAFKGGLTMELVNVRKNDGTEVVLTVSGVSLRDGGLKGVWLATSGEDTSKLLQEWQMRLDRNAADPLASTVVEARGAVDPDAGARLFQQLMVGGGTTTVKRAAGSQSYVIAGPMPHAVRSAFLNCSGDLFPRTR